MKTTGTCVGTTILINGIGRLVFVRLVVCFSSVPLCFCGETEIQLAKPNFEHAFS